MQVEKRGGVISTHVEVKWGCVSNLDWRVVVGDEIAAAAAAR